jgi:CHAD domain-containing protein
MAYRLKRSRAVGKGLKRVAGQQLKKAAKQLRAGGAQGGEDPIHEARKSIKKVRALLRLIQDELGAACRGESARLRQAGRNLSPVRDAEALITAFDRLVKRRKVRKGDVASIRIGLVEHKTRLEEKIGLAELMARDGFKAIRGGLKKTFHRGRKAMWAALKSRSREDLHEWRKRVKDHWYYVRLLTAESPCQRRLKALENALG